MMCSGTALALVSFVPKCTKLPPTFRLFD